MKYFLIISFHKVSFVIIMAKLFMPKCLECKERLKKCNECKVCWARKTDQLTMLMQIDVRKMWRAIPARWKDRLIIFFNFWRDFWNVIEIRSNNMIKPIGVLFALWFLGAKQKHSRQAYKRGSPRRNSKNFARTCKKSGNSLIFLSMSAS